MNDEDDGPESEPTVDDWSQPSEEESRQLLGLSPEERAELVELHPELAKFVRVGIQAIREGSSSERATAAELARAYFELTQKTIDGLLKRLGDPGVTYAETKRIYKLLDAIEARAAAKDTEYQRANARLGDKERLYIGLFAGVGIALAVVLVSQGRGSAGGFVAR